MKHFTLLGYAVNVVESNEELQGILDTCPEAISLLAFDTETDTKIDMSKRDASNIDIMHDKPFLLQFGFGRTVYLVDFRVSGIHTDTALEVFDELRKRATLCLAHNIKFDINMLYNIGYSANFTNACDTMSIARLALESKSEREGGYSMGLKPLAARLLGTSYADAGREIDAALRTLWEQKLKELALLLKPYKISRRQINDTLKDVTGSMDEYTEEVQEIWYRWNIRSRVTYADVDPEVMWRYGATDVILVLELANMLLPIVRDKNQMDVLKREIALVMPLVRMERTGYTVDKQYLIRCKSALVFEINQIKEQNFRIAGEWIKPNQHLAIKDMLLRKFGYDLESTDKNKMHILIQTDKTMPDEAKRYLENVIYLRTLEKWIATYLNPMLYKLNSSGDTKVYTMYNPNGAVSGRFTSNFQQFPKNGIYSKLGDFELFHPRRMFTVDKDFAELAYIDYSQVELRLQAEYTHYVTHGYGDVNMLRAYLPFKCTKNGEDWIEDDTGEVWKGVDLHTQSTCNAFPDVDVNSPEFKKLRYVGKRVNFALIYGASLRKVQEAVADADPEVVAKLYHGFHDRFKGVAAYGNWVSSQWINSPDGHVTNLLGRRYYIKDAKDVYKLNNYLIQGSAADMIKLAIIKIDNMLLKGGYKTRLQGCIHDELCVCVAEGEHDVLYKIKHIMENTIKTFVPIVAEIEVTNTTWADKHEE
jgi:DNA polymerase-1